MFARHAWILALVRTALKAALARPWASALGALLMAMNNLTFFMVWWVLMAAVGHIKGWQLPEIAVLSGFGSMSFGLAFLLAGGALDISRTLRDGGLDVHLAHPKSPLVCLVLRHADPECVGDIASGIIVLSVFGGVTVGQGLGIAGLALLAACVWLSITIIIHSLAFWLKGQRTTQQVFDSFVVSSTFPVHAMPLWIKTVLLTVFPVGFISLVPVDIIRNFAGWKLAVMVMATAVLAFLAVYIFHRGLRRYTSGSQMTEVR
ncbi:MAG: ABC-2 family transporter protein [Pseudomonadota bacterium]|nr:ABC-2 family transporter protein [Pseudomonadota bacterium]